MKHKVWTSIFQVIRAFLNYIKHLGLVELQKVCHFINISTSLSFIDMDGEYPFFFIDICDSVSVIVGCIKVNLPSSGVAVKIIVHGITTIWSSTQWIGDYVSATNITISFFHYCKIKM